MFMSYDQLHLENNYGTKIETFFALLLLSEKQNFVKVVSSGRSFRAYLNISLSSSVQT